MNLKIRFSRKDIADALLARFNDEMIERCRSAFKAEESTSWFMIDDLLPAEMAHAIRCSFPDASQMRERKNLREHKYVAAQMNRYDPQAEEALFAFHDDRVVELIAKITGLGVLHADPKLYAGGISVMQKGNFLNPHLDNSHNNDRDQYRVLNLLFYVSPDWTSDCGGHLELWPYGVKAKPLTIESAFNRLVVMATGPTSWHSVSPVQSSQPRYCVSNYYFSPKPLGGKDYFRVTTFRGRPEQPARDIVLQLDSLLREGLRKIRPRGFVPTTHIYKKD